MLIGQSLGQPITGQALLIFVQIFEVHIDQRVPKLSWNRSEQHSSPDEFIDEIDN
jgi:hypothetical protein